MASRLSAKTLSRLEWSCARTFTAPPPVAKKMKKNKKGCNMMWFLSLSCSRVFIKHRWIGAVVPEADDIRRSADEDRHPAPGCR